MLSSAGARKRAKSYIEKMEMCYYSKLQGMVVGKVSFISLKNYFQIIYLIIFYQSKDAGVCVTMADM